MERPTTSVRRQRVHVTEDVTQTLEDVPQLNEDVPHVSDATPEMTGAVDAANTEGVATDGSEGSSAANEGFPGGPCDPSILTGFAEHVAHSIWSGQHRETSTFHLLVGELTITLDDMASLLHLPITGTLHTFEPLVTSDTVVLLTELLEVSPEEARAETHQASGPHVWLSWLWDVYESRCQARWDLAQTGGFSWGAAALVHFAGYTSTFRWCISASLMMLMLRQAHVPLGSLWFITPNEDSAEPSHPPTPYDKEFVEPPIPKVPVASDLPTHLVVDCQGCEAMAEDLERVINLRMVTEGTNLYDIMARCLRIATGDDADGSLRPRQRRCIG
ncbi:hypothetical protein GmHk_05G013410 [Glycine max]|nr:hypothetical protein GmHk_05G013410 [Glycine max]